MARGHLRREGATLSSSKGSEMREQPEEAERRPHQAARPSLDLETGAWRHTELPLDTAAHTGILREASK